MDEKYDLQQSTELQVFHTLDNHHQRPMDSFSCSKVVLDWLYNQVLVHLVSPPFLFNEKYIKLNKTMKDVIPYLLRQCQVKKITKEQTVFELVNCFITKLRNCLTIHFKRKTRCLGLRPLWLH